MAYSKKEKEDKFDNILELIEEEQLPLHKALKRAELSSSTFYMWIEEDEVKSKRYAGACAERADRIFEEILDIADETKDDVKVIPISEGVSTIAPNPENIQRSRLKVDARKWVLSKMNPKKYADRQFQEIKQTNINQLEDKEDSELDDEINKLNDKN